MQEGGGVGGGGGWGAEGRFKREVIKPGLDSGLDTGFWTGLSVDLGNCAWFLCN